MYGHQRTDSWNSPRRRTTPAGNDLDSNSTKRYSTGMNYGGMDGSESSSTTGGFTTVGRATAGFYSPTTEGNGGTGNEKTNRERINQIVQSFFWKAAMVIIQSRMNVTPLLSAKTREKKTNKWFNIELDEMDSFREELRLWRAGDSFEPRPPPLIIETYLDTSDLTPTQALVILDGENKRWNVTEALENAAARAGLNAGGSGTKHQIVLERWTVELSPPLDLVNATELPVVYKKAIILFRALYSYVSLMPTWKFRRRLAKLKINTSALKVSCRVLNGDDFARSSRRFDGLQIPLLEGEPDVTENYSFGKVESPAGQFNISVLFRRNCNFRVDDSEALLSSQFINLDEHYFRPTGHQRTISQPQFAAAREPGSLPSNVAGLGQRPDYLGYGSLSSFHQQQGALTSASPITALRNAAEIADRTSANGSPIDRPSTGLRSIQGSKSSLRSLEGAGISRRGSISFMQPFKSPSLSASPATSDMAPSASAGRVVPSGPVHKQRASVGTMSSSSYKSAAPPAPAETPSHTPIPIAGSPKPQSMTRITSSFGGRRPRVASGASLGKDEDNNSSGKASYSSSTAAPGSGLYAESAGSAYEDDLNIQQFMSLIADGQKQSLKSFQPNSGNDAASKRMGNALQRFQKMRDSQSALADSLSSSLVLQPSGSPSSSASRQLSNVPGMIASTAFSSSSSPGKPMSPHTPHTPAVPSRLSEGLTAQYGQSREHRFHRPSSPQGPDTDTRTRAPRDQDEGAATTSPLDIPLSPRLFGPRRSNSMSQQREPLQGGGMEFESASLGSVDMVPLSMSRLLDLRNASESGLPGRDGSEIEARQPNDGDSDEGLAFGPPRPPSMDSAEGEGPRCPPQFRRGTGLASSGSSYRNRYSARGRGNTPPTGSTSSLERERGSGISADPRGAFGRRTPSWSRPGEDEDLLFAMSDMLVAQQSRRSLEQERGVGGDSASSSRRRSRGGAGSGDGRGGWGI